MLASIEQTVAGVLMGICVLWLLCTALLIRTLFLKRTSVGWFAVAMVGTCIGGFATFALVLMAIIGGLGHDAQFALIAAGFAAVPFILGLSSLLRLNRCRRNGVVSPSGETDV